MTIKLHIYFNGEAVEMDKDHIAEMTRHSANDDAAWGPEHAPYQPYTAIKLEEGQTTSQGVGTAYVAETPEEILALDNE